MWHLFSMYLFLKDFISAIYFFSKIFVSFSSHNLYAVHWLISKKQAMWLNLKVHAYLLSKLNWTRALKFQCGFLGQTLWLVLSPLTLTTENVLIGKVKRPREGFFLTSATEKTKTQGQNSSKKLKQKTQPLGATLLKFEKLKKQLIFWPNFQGYP